MLSVSIWARNCQKSFIETVAPGFDPDNEEGFEFDFVEMLKIAAGHENPYEKENRTKQETDLWISLSTEVQEYCGVELVHHCSGDHPMYFLSVLGTEKVAYRGRPKRIAALSEISQEQIAKLKLFCERYDIEWQEPSWHLMSMWMW